MKNKNPVSFKIRKKVFERDNSKCQKCGFSGITEELEVHHMTLRVDGGEHNVDNLMTLCSICHYYAPDSEKDFKEYLDQKIDGTILDTFRKSQKSISKRSKKGMLKRFNQGNVITRAPFGYKIENKQLIHHEDSYKVQEIYQEFLNNNISLTQLAKKHNLSVNGLKKILTNYAYLGKTKFDGKIIDGKHKPLISHTLFNQVQEKLKTKLRK